jgi:hypothetical protein
MKLLVFIIVLTQFYVTYAYITKLSSRSRSYLHRLSFSPSSSTTTTKYFPSRTILAYGGNIKSTNQLSTLLKFKVADAETETLEIEEKEEEVNSDEVNNNNGVLRKISKNIIPIAASIGFAVTPSSSIAARIAGAAVGGVSGLLAKRLVLDKYFDEEFEDLIGKDKPPYSPSVAAALSQLVAHPKIMTMSLKDVENIAKKNRVQKEELSILFSHLFAEIVYITTDSAKEDLTELIDVVDFAANLELSKSEIGDGFALAVVRIGRQLQIDDEGFFTVEYPENLLLQASKVFFLGEKLLGEYKGFYGKRLATGLYVQWPKEVYNEIITTACKYLFKRCIESVLSNPASFTEDEVKILREYISTTAEVSSFRPSNMQNMILEAVQYSIDASISDSSNMDANIKNYDNLVKAQSILGWNAVELQASIETKTLPLFESAAKHVIDDIYLHPDHGMKYDGFFEERVNNLHIDPKHARVIIMNILSAKNKDYMKTIDKVYGIAKDNLDPVYKLMVSYSRSHDELTRLTKNIMNDLKLPIPGLPFADRIRAGLYEMKLRRLEAEQTAATAAELNDELFDLAAQQRVLVKKSIALPKITAWIQQCFRENELTSEAKQAYRNLLQEYSVSEQEWLNTAIDFYYQEVQTVAASRAVPSSFDLDRLQGIRTFLGVDSSNALAEEMISKVHVELFGDKYIKALNECMTPTGVIVEEYVDSLNRLRTRLGLSEADSKTLLAYVVRTRMIPLVKGLLEQYQSVIDPKKVAEKQQKRNQRQQSDPISSPDNRFGYVSTPEDEDDFSMLGIDSAQKVGGGPNVFMREALNLIDNFQQNFKILELEDVKPSIIKLSSESELSTVAQDEEMSRLPVRATGILPEEDLVDLMKHYIITRISERDASLRARYLMNEEIFADALGITQGSVLKLKESIAYATNKKVFRNILRYKATLSPSDMQQIAALKDSLSLAKERADEIYYQASKGAVIEYCKEIFSSGLNEAVPSTFKADDAQRLRLQVC